MYLYWNVSMTNVSIEHYIEGSIRYNKKQKKQEMKNKRYLGDCIKQFFNFSCKELHMTK